ncbi:lantibiotic immunity ABC transporter MutE/EpiE family permease subunit [Clostridium thermosuccinogenes]|uniref:lantibiotic immunity ABC transporter MutE/EpiE family permease subunit n=1 Tax=Clostridium thermosuccinogenes TaxID=84032 RepID=UPI000CCBE764|nr:multidrug ABC transporter permease [Pseudoclostridium thermosuccinogenes]
MMNILQSEFLKYKRTFTRRLILLAPMFFIFMALPQKLFMPANYLRSWQLILDLVFNWWPVVFIPMGLALFAALTESQEKKAGSYRSLRARDVSPANLWVAKVVIMGFHTLISTLVLIGATVISGLITGDGSIPWFKIFAGGLTTWIVSLAIIPLQLWMAAWKGTFASMATGFLGLIAGVIASAGPYWLYVPWSWPTRLMCPIIGVHPNGTLLESTSSLLNASVIPKGILISLAALVIFTFITAVWFNNREVR